MFRDANKYYQFVFQFVVILKIITFMIIKLSRYDCCIFIFIIPSMVRTQQMYFSTRWKKMVTRVLNQCTITKLARADARVHD